MGTSPDQDGPVSRQDIERRVPTRFQRHICVLAGVFCVLAADHGALVAISFVLVGILDVLVATVGVLVGGFDVLVAGGPCPASLVAGDAPVGMP